jgi:DNA-binding PadR family transcriptional regulator
MPPMEPEILQGTLELLILNSLALEERHGLGISRRLAQITNGTGHCFPPCIGSRKPNERPSSTV